MRHHIAVPLCVLVCAILCAPALCAAEDNPPEVTVKGRGFHFTVALTRFTYLEGEPVLAKCSITNDLKKTQKLVEPNAFIEWTVRYLSTGRVVTCGSGDIAVGPRDYWELRGFQTMSHYHDLRGQSADPPRLPCGDYEVVMNYVAPDAIRADWVGTLKTRPLRFTVAAPEGMEAEVFRVVCSTEPSSGTIAALRERVALMERTAKENPTSRYACLLKYRVAKVLERTDKVAYKAALQSYIETDSRTPFFGRIGYAMLGLLYEQQGNYRAARRAYSLQPDGLYREILVRSCNRAEAEASAANK